jgi:hypothetical protein
MSSKKKYDAVSVDFAFVNQCFDSIIITTIFEGD